MCLDASSAQCTIVKRLNPTPEYSEIFNTIYEAQKLLVALKFVFKDENYDRETSNGVLHSQRLVAIANIMSGLFRV